MHRVCPYQPFTLLTLNTFSRQILDISSASLLTKLMIFFTVVLGKFKMMSAMAIRILRVEHKKIEVTTRLWKMYCGRKSMEQEEIGLQVKEFWIVCKPMKIQVYITAIPYRLSK